MPTLESVNHNVIVPNIKSNDELLIVISPIFSTYIFPHPLKIKKPPNISQALEIKPAHSFDRMVVSSESTILEGRKISTIFWMSSAFMEVLSCHTTIQAYLKKGLLSS